MTTRYRPGLLAERFRAIERNIRIAGERAIETTASDAQQKLDAVVATWENQPTFEVVRLTTPTSIKRHILIRGNAKAVAIFGYVDQGTPAHVIRPKKPGGKLAFQTGYDPKTRFKARFGGAGKASGATVFANEVHHPGTEAREFVQTYREEAVLQLRKELHKELSRRL